MRQPRSIGSGQGSTGRHRMSYVWGASFEDRWLHGGRRFGGDERREARESASALEVDGKKASFVESSVVELARLITSLGRHMVCNRPEQSRWCLRLLHGTSNCCWQSKEFFGIVDEPTLQHEFVSQLQKCRQNTSCGHLLENLRGPDRNESTLDVMVEIRKYCVTIGCPGCMAITAGTTAQGHSDECRARIEQKMLEGRHR